MLRLRSRPYGWLAASALLALAGCSSASTGKPATAGAGAPPGAKLAAGPISPARRVSSRKPTVVVGGPVVFRAPDPDSASAGTKKKVRGWAYILVLKLNRDPFAPGGGENNNGARGSYSFAGMDASGDNGLRKSSGKYCFVSYYSGSEVNAFSIEELETLKVGELVRVEARPRAARPNGRRFLFDVPLLEAVSQDVTDKGSLRKLRAIDCGPPSL